MHVYVSELLPWNWKFKRKKQKKIKNLAENCFLSTWVATVNSLVYFFPVFKHIFSNFIKISKRTLSGPTTKITKWPHKSLGPPSLSFTFCPFRNLGKKSPTKSLHLLSLLKTYGATSRTLAENVCSRFWRQGRDRGEARRQRALLCQYQVRLEEQLDRFFDMD